MPLEDSVERTILPSEDEAEGVVVRHRGAGWLAVPGGLTRQRARTLLADRWADLDGSLAAIRDRLLESEPVAVVHADGTTMLELVRTPPPGSAQQHPVSYQVPGPTTAAAVRKGLAKRGIDADPLLAGFLEAFNGLRDQALPMRGSFVPPSRWRTVESLLGEWWSDETERVPKWYKEDCVIYEGLSGDSLLYGKSGRIGWHIFSEARYQRFWNSFKSFLRFYAEFQDIFHPLDFYSTERFLQRG